jgi:FixJ family two-component response regulator
MATSTDLMDPARWHRENLLMDHPILLSLVDDDESVRESVPDLLRQSGFSIRAFSAAQDFLDSDVVSQTRCLILDVAMPEMSGPDLLRELRRRGQQVPIVFITAQAGDTIRSQLMAQGAVECLFKPFSEEAILEAVGTALRGKGT